MKKSNEMPVQVVLTYNPSGHEKESLKATVDVLTQTEDKITKLDDNDKLVRRYSFDDNGGSYRGL